MISNYKKPINILLAEDNPGDVFLVDNTLGESHISYNLHHVFNGKEVLEFLNQEWRYVSKSRPDLILLDLNLPLKHGFEVLKEIKSIPEFSIIPVIILTSSKEEKDIVRSYALAANCFVTKPVDLNEFSEVIKSLENFWLNFVQFPPQ